MSGRARIDGLKFAREGRRLHGELAIAGLARLEDVLFDPAGVVSFVLLGSTNAQGKPVIDVEVEGTLALVCQRCLGRMDYPLRRKSRFILIECGQAMPDVGDEDPNTENMPVDELSDVSDIIEQEVLLGLPFAPLHDESACDAGPELPRTMAESPFAALGKLKRT